MTYSNEYLQKRADELNLTKCTFSHCYFCESPTLGMYAKEDYIVCGYCLAVGFDESKATIKLPF